jgi:hypothetical protein
MEKYNDITNWIAEIHIHSSNLKSLPSEIIERSILVSEFRIFRFTSLEISIFYNLYSLAHKWKKTKIIVNGHLIECSPDVTKVFRCCYDASDWPKRQNEFYRNNGHLEKYLEIQHYCYGYDRTIHNIIGCQKVKTARDNYVLRSYDIKTIEIKEEDTDAREGWMDKRFIDIKDGNFEINIDKLTKEILDEWNIAAQYCPFMVKERILYGLNILKDATTNLKDYWTVEVDGTLNPKPIEYYFDIDFDRFMGSKFMDKNSLVYFIILSKILKLSLHETVLLIAFEHPSPGFTIDFNCLKSNKVYVKFEIVENLLQKQALIIPTKTP